MAFFPLSGITGCVSPASGITTGYDIMYNKASITSFYKKDIVEPALTTHMVVISIDNYHVIFKFDTLANRDTFYNFLLT